MNAPLEEANAGLIKQARAGDARAFEALAKEVERPLYRHVQRIVGESADAEDCVQDALFSAWRSIRAFEGDSFRAWIFRIATNRALDRLRSRKRHPELPLDPPADDAEITWAEPATPGPDLVQIVGDREALAAVEAALATLPVDQRTVLLLRDIEGFAYEEIAVITAVEIGTVKSRIHLGRRCRRAGARAAAGAGAERPRPRDRQCRSVRRGGRRRPRRSERPDRRPRAGVRRTDRRPRAGLRRGGVGLTAAEERHRGGPLSRRHADAHALRAHGHWNDRADRGRARRSRARPNDPIAAPVARARDRAGGPGARVAPEATKRLEADTRWCDRASGPDRLEQPHLSRLLRGAAAHDDERRARERDVRVRLA